PSNRRRCRGWPLQGEAVARVPLRRHPGGASRYGIKQGKKENGRGSVSSACEEVADHCRDLLRMSLEREVTGVEEMDYGIGNIALERLSAARQEKRIILPPHRQEARLVRPEVVLECRVQRDVALVVAEQVQLDLVGAGSRQIEVVQ